MFSKLSIDNGASLLLGNKLRKLFTGQQVEPFLRCIAGEAQQLAEGCAGDEMMFSQICVQDIDDLLSLILLGAPYYPTPSFVDC